MRVVVVASSGFTWSRPVGSQSPGALVGADGRDAWHPQDCIIEDFDPQKTGGTLPEALLAVDAAPWILYLPVYGVWGHSTPLLGGTMPRVLWLGPVSPDTADDLCRRHLAARLPEGEIGPCLPRPSKGGEALGDFFRRAVIGDPVLNQLEELASRQGLPRLEWERDFSVFQPGLFAIDDLHRIEDLRRIKGAAAFLLNAANEMDFESSAVSAFLASPKRPSLDALWAGAHAARRNPFDQLPSEPIQVNRWLVLAAARAWWRDSLVKQLSVALHDGSIVVEAETPGDPSCSRMLVPSALSRQGRTDMILDWLHDVMRPMDGAASGLSVYREVRLTAAAEAEGSGASQTMNASPPPKSKAIERGEREQKALLFLTSNYKKNPRCLTLADWAHLLDKGSAFNKPAKGRICAAFFAACWGASTGGAAVAAEAIGRIEERQEKAAAELDEAQQLFKPMMAEGASLARRLTSAEAEAALVRVTQGRLLPRRGRVRLWRELREAQPDRWPLAAASRHQPKASKPSAPEPKKDDRK